MQEDSYIFFALRPNSTHLSFPGPAIVHSANSSSNTSNRLLRRSQRCKTSLE